jgi:hypothetical protein
MQLCKQRTQTRGILASLTLFLSSNAQNFLLVNDDS